MDHSPLSLHVKRGWLGFSRSVFLTYTETEPMFEYLDLDAPGASTVSSTQPLPPHPGSPSPGSRSPHPERVRHLLYGSLAALDRTIKIFHALGYAEPNDWSDPLPVPQGGVAPLAISAVEEVPPSGVEVWMVILTKTLFLE